MHLLNLVEPAPIAISKVALYEDSLGRQATDQILVSCDFEKCTHLIDIAGFHSDHPTTLVKILTSKFQSC